MLRLLPPVDIAFIGSLVNLLCLRKKKKKKKKKKKCLCCAGFGLFINRSSCCFPHRLSLTVHGVTVVSELPILGLMMTLIVIVRLVVSRLRTERSNFRAHILSSYLVAELSRDCLASNCHVLPGQEKE
ncbi:hypothetical protein GGR55DRAFT_683248 [Xylaria sp. FL0064]|nr:hypothetical protein GGR55DRAFT_683248 [Xylaria sp. FL0064]